MTSGETKAYIIHIGRLAQDHMEHENDRRSGGTCLDSRSRGSRPRTILALRPASPGCSASTCRDATFIRSKPMFLDSTHDPSVVSTHSKQ